MKLLIVAIFLFISIISFINVNAYDDDDDSESIDDDFFKRFLIDRKSYRPREPSNEIENYKRSVDFSNPKYYKDTPKHPERLRLCVTCVGKQREKGQNVKQATNHCNKICKRGLFETRSFEAVDGLFE